MSLKKFHVLFITASILLAVGFGAWCLSYPASSGDATFLTMGLASFAVAVGLAAYGRWFLARVRTREEDDQRRRRMLKTISALVVVWLLSIRGAPACSVCYGEAEGPLIDAARVGVYLLFGLVLAVQICFGMFFIHLRKRSRAFKDDRPTEPPQDSDKGAA